MRLNYQHGCTTRFMLTMILIKMHSSELVDMKHMEIYSENLCLIFDLLHLSNFKIFKYSALL